ncbi:hypothetical protein NC653_024754 [Populus alba x Populus x berolinensis]|uniref:Gnk2-homologous domain-containing protein n=1 Tax=Populus alba x Populus x berolinensis TaxID=444605 RepID=A0AAD6Q942_9ROSI|nr:hypothetical protein NC653_024754 [Populus alba x Populus x berolinensis]
MGFPSKPFFCSLFLSTFLFVSLSQSAPDYSTLIYKGCAKQAFQDPNGVYSQAISALFGSLVSQSTKTKFFKTTAGTGQTTITGLFQCRGDLSNTDCYNCVSKLPILTDKLCGKTIAARIQLYGCYILYEVAGFAQISGMEMLYKTCGAKNIAGSGFEERRDTALSVMQNGVVSGHGFYATNYQSVYVLGQCEGDVGDSDCGECVTTAVQRAQRDRAKHREDGGHYSRRGSWCGVPGHLLAVCKRLFSFRTLFHNPFINTLFSPWITHFTKAPVFTVSAVVLLLNGAIKPPPLVIILNDSFIQNRIASGLITKKTNVSKGEGENGWARRSTCTRLELVAFIERYPVSLFAGSLRSRMLGDRSAVAILRVKGHQDVSPPIVAKIPKSYVPNVIMPKVSVSEEAEKKSNSTEEDRLNIRASSIPRPRAVLSSPDNDAVIGSNNWTKVARPTASKNNKLMESRHEPCKVVPGQITDASPSNTRKSKNTSDNKSELKVKKWSPPEASSQRRKIATDKPRFMRI